MTMTLIAERNLKNHAGMSFCKFSSASITHTNANKTIATIIRELGDGNSNIAQANSEGMTDSKNIVRALLGAVSIKLTASPHWIPPRNDRMTAA